MSAGFLARAGHLGVSALAVSFGLGPSLQPAPPASSDLIGLTMQGSQPAFATLRFPSYFTSVGSPDSTPDTAPFSSGSFTLAGAANAPTTKDE